MRLKRPEGLNIIPFIDIMLALLAIVLTVATFVSKQENIKVDVPNAREEVTKIPERSHEIVVKQNGEIVFEGVNVSLQDLKTRLSALSFNEAIVIKADKKSEFGVFIQIIDFLKQQHRQYVNIAVQKD
jgi:biopolymer transport protein ExbD